ncbi:MAG: lamin tail domain-containing protein [Verrucomicrobiota bacterium]
MLWCAGLALALAGNRAEAEQVVISKIMFRPPAGLPAYIELCNHTSQPMDMAQWRLSGGVKFEFPAYSDGNPRATFLLPKERIVITEGHALKARTAYQIPAGVRIFGPWKGELAPEGDKLNLKDKNGLTLCTVSYGSGRHWPVSTRGAGHALVLKNPDGTVDDWRNWTASDLPGGAPGTELPRTNTVPTAPRLNEVHFKNRTTLDWIELYNPTPTKLSLDGMFLASQPAFADRVPLKGELAPGAVLAWKVAFKVGAQSVPVFLVGTSNVVVDGRAFTFSPFGDTYQAYPDGGQEWYLSKNHTRNDPNQPARNLDIVINEIMCEPPSVLTNAPQYVELYNRGKSTVNLSGWSFAEGIDFVFPRGTKIAPGGYLVGASNTNRMREIYGNIPVVGNFKGKLSHHGELLRLVDALGNLANEVDYHTGGDWPALAAGGGSSLELMNPWLDNRLASAWRDSDESRKSVMREYRGSAKYEQLNTMGGPTDYKELYFHLVGEGHLLLENVWLGKPGGTNFLVNTDRLSDDGRSAKGWLAQGTHADTFITNGQLHIIADGHGDNRPNRVELDALGLTKGEMCELRFNARWISGLPRLIASTWEHSLTASFLVDLPLNLGTPGKPNSRLVAQPPPQVDDLRHRPVVPRSKDDIQITARITAATTPVTVQLYHRLDTESGANAWTKLVMRDDGPASGGLAGSHWYTAILTNYHRSGAVVQFYVAATGPAGQTCLQPRAGSDRPALLIVDDQSIPRDLRNVRFIVSAYDADSMQRGNTAKYGYRYPRLSNHHLNATMIVNEEEIFYGGEIRNAGSPFCRAEGLQRPKFKLPGDQSYRGRRHYYFDNDPQGNNFHNEVCRYWLYLSGLPASESEVVRVKVNQNGPELFDDTETMGSEFLNRCFKHGSRGQLFRIDDEWWFTDDWTPQNRDADWQYKGTDNPGRYRTEWMKRTNEVEDDYTSLIRFFKLMSGDKYTQEEMEQVMDVEAVMKLAVVRGYTADYDNFTMDRGKNAFFYEKTDGRFMFLQWDSDLGFGDPNMHFYGERVRVWMEKPWNRRLFSYYLDQFEKSLKTNQRFRTWLELFRESGSKKFDVNQQFYLDFCNQRGGAVKNTLGSEWTAPLQITPLNATNTVTNATVTLTGTAPSAYFALQLVEAPKLRPAWKDQVKWEFRDLPVRPGENRFTVRGLSHTGEVLGEQKAVVQRLSDHPH